MLVWGGVRTGSFHCMGGWMRFMNVVKTHRRVAVAK